MRLLLYLFHIFESRGLCSAPRAPAVTPLAGCLLHELFARSQLQRSFTAAGTVCGVSQSLRGAGAIHLGYKRGFFQKPLAS